MSIEEQLFDQVDERRARYEDILLSILSSEGKIESFVDTIFNFLWRRTDFFLIQERTDQAFGFPKGVAKQIVTQTFQRYDNLSKDIQKKRLLETNENVARSETTIQNEKKQEQDINKPKHDELIEKKPETKIETTACRNELANRPLEEQQKVFQSNASSYNGAIRDKYSWTQTIKDIDVHVQIDKTIKSSKQVKIKIERENLQVSVLDQKTNNWQTIVDDKLPWKIKPELSTWSLLPSEHVHIYLEKSQERWWENLLVSESKLDLKFMNPEKPMEDLEETAQAKLKQMMYDEHQKRLGLPTSEQQIQNDILRKAWDLDGSPFKGMPFDPSIVKMNNNLPHDSDQNTQN